MRIDCEVRVSVICVDQIDTYERSTNNFQVPIHRLFDSVKFPCECYKWVALSKLVVCIARSRSVGAGFSRKGSSNAGRDAGCALADGISCQGIITRVFLDVACIDRRSSQTGRKKKPKENMDEEF